MRKLLVILALAVLWAGVRDSDAASPARGAKASATVSYTTTVSSVSIPGATVVYGVVMSTGATGDYVALFDTSTVTGITAALTTSNVLKSRCMAGSTITTTMCNYDPPLQFNNGVAAILSTAADHALIIYEKGRIPVAF